VSGSLLWYYINLVSLVYKRIYGTILESSSKSTLLVFEINEAASI
jgi:hypothetical protein